ncbi:hypothetical protein QR680_011608 [Steinernema hermaphroditum]|uniref:DNA mismatch repair proteins mutS family domain-containing protein n=1 Tax=Steinernema hermaphroditum TaxID=289476 RepID=A0AA39LZ97_9BILA|nr:hypothetical protein QR680_011608 [Steinernema hermaphroditum]
MTTFDSPSASKSFGPKYKVNTTRSFGTPGNNTTSKSSKFTVIALVEGRGNARGEIGMASMDVRFSEVNICQLMDTSSYALLKIRLELLNPVEVIVPELTNDKNNMNVLLELIKSTCKAVQVTTVHRRYFNEGRGAEIIKQLAVPECSNIDGDVLKKYYCVSAFAALIRYVEYVQNTLFAQNSLKITYENSENSCMIDLHTLRNLEVISMTSKHERDSLYSVLNTCLTASGERTLRSNLLQPSANLDSINAKLDCVEELVNNHAMLERLRAVLSYMHDLGAVITVCVHLSRGGNVRNAKQTIQQIINLQKTLQMLESLRKVLSLAKSKTFLSCANCLRDARLKKIHNMIDAKIDVSAFTRSDRRGSLAVKEQMIMAVRSGIEVLLDVPRRAYQELVVDVQQQGIEEAKNVPGATMVYSVQKGFHMTVPTQTPYKLKLPHNLIQVVKNRSSVSFTTRSLIQYNDRIQQFENEILLQSGVVVDGLLTEIRTLIPSLYHCIEVISACDYAASLAFMVIKQGRHPVLEQNCDATSNDTYLAEESRFVMITGPNMAGKSTYLKQVCLLQILAQMGSMVPAEFASFKLMTRIFSRVGHNDDLNANLSAFALEMSEMNIITQFADADSLVVIDELARSTSTEEGIGISYAICERLIAKHAYVLFATHFLDLALLEMNYPAVQNCHFAVEIHKDADGREILETTHKMCKGTYKGPLYGLELAELTTFPSDIVEKARSLAQKLRVSAEQRHNIADSEVDIRIMAQLAHKIAQAFPRAAEIDTEQLSAYLNQLRIAYKKDTFRTG